jgi:hypothetical protein
MLIGSLRELAGEGYPALQHLRSLRIGDQCRQILCPQGEIAARQVVGIGHYPHYKR